ncbi:MAG TPA: type II secretion system F family protein [Acidobacteriota bacterium]|jgi:type IV pilus assembly protein PilC|nr:type II secretion system F family protein [Acidobacteriota bacterium]HNT17116.1 type II secretion system F family protein [Acidobacteriota bacterium]HPA26128.1 type II secretion system F family protein [Acidobacteriota bacterium]HQO19239.1 type II secretion system F family protein [Acidobacteriota bacterium]HQQ46051.1 type II secretion system F family protein [Acidobacteriota bacterium]
MPGFVCRIGSSSGDVVQQEITGVDAASVSKQLEDKGYTVFSVKPKQPWEQYLAMFSPKRKSVKMSTFITFNQEFAALINAGLPILTALELLLQRKRAPLFQRMLEDVREEVKTGASLSQAFANRGDYFPKLYPATIASGERTGEIVKVIKRYLFYMETVQAIKKKMTSAMIYPVILMTMTVGLIVLLMTVIVPKFATLFAGAGAELPTITKIVLGISWVFQKGWPFALAAAFASPIIIKMIGSKPEGRLKLAKLRMKIPVFGTNIQRYNIAQFSRTLGTLVSGGIPLVQALDIVADAMSNELFKVELKKARTKVLEGESLWASLEATGIVTPLAIEMVQVGEATGALSDMLEQVSNFYDQELSTSVERLMALLEPIMLIIMAVLVAVVVLSVYMPLFSMYNLVSG